MDYTELYSFASHQSGFVHKGVLFDFLGVSRCVKSFPTIKLYGLLQLCINICVYPVVCIFHYTEITFSGMTMPRSHVKDKDRQGFY